MNSFNPVFTIGKTMEEMLKLQGGKMTKEQRRAKMEELTGDGSLEARDFGLLSPSVERRHETSGQPLH